MQQKRIILVIFAFIFLSSLVFKNRCVWAEDKTKAVYQLEPILVYPSMSNEYFENSLRHIEYLDTSSGTEFTFLPDWLNSSAVADAQRRGPFSTQADIQIRGASFEQTDILIDGIKINDPQTGHFNLDIPFFHEDIEKIVVIAGPTAALSGAGRQGGSIHIFTRKPHKKKTTAKVIFGENSFNSQTISSTYFVRDIALRTTLNQITAGDYRPNTDFKNLGFSQTCLWENAYGQMQFNLGVLDKKFGANGFYSEFFPQQKEFTNTIFSSLSFKSELKDISINPQVYLRRHKDRFLLDKTNSSFYENFHTNYTKGAKLDLAKEFEAVQIFLGDDFAQEEIDSSNLGKHARWRNTLYGTHIRYWHDFVLSLGLTGYFYNNFKDLVSPEAALSYNLNETAKIRSAFNKSIRIPTFTELYYISPANIGNEELQPEKSSNYEMGLDFERDCFTFSATYFKRYGKNLIDWVREKEATVYQIQNIAEVNTSGVELDLKIYPEKINRDLNDFRKIFFSYAYIDRNRVNNDYVSKYVFDYLKHKIVTGTEYRLLFDIIAGIRVDYLQRVNTGEDFIVYADFTKNIKNYSLFIKIDNLFNHAYSEKSNIPMPGRWIFTGVKVDW